jgi:hypothetical protein
LLLIERLYWGIAVNLCLAGKNYKIANFLNREPPFYQDFCPTSPAQHDDRHASASASCFRSSFINESSWASADLPHDRAAKGPPRLFQSETSFGIRALDYHCCYLHDKWAKDGHMFLQVLLNGPSSRLRKEISRFR